MRSSGVTLLAGLGLAATLVSAAAINPAIPPHSLQIYPRTTCPVTNGTSYNATTGSQYEVDCGIDFPGGDLRGNPVYTAGLLPCLETCARTPSCVGASYIGGRPSGVCYLKHTIGAPKPRSNIVSGRLLPPPPPPPPPPPLAIVVAASPSPSPPALPTTADIAANASLVLGHRIAGAALDQAQASVVCAQHTAAAAANATSWSPCPACAVEALRPYATNVFLARLLRVCVGAPCYARLCGFLDAGLLGQMQLDGDRVVDAVCGFGGTARPASSSSSSSAAAAEAHLPGDVQPALTQWESVLLAYEAMAGVSLTGQLEYLCGHFAGLQGGLLRQGVSLGDFQLHFCDRANWGLTPAELVERLATYASNVFGVQMEAASQDPVYLSWVCENVAPNALDAVGVQGGRVISGICGKSAAASR